MTLSELAAALKELTPRVAQSSSGCYVLVDEGESIDEGWVREWLEACGGDLKEAERGMNHRHIADLVTWQEEAYQADDLLVIGDTYGRLLRYELSTGFPDVAFEVETIGEQAVDCEPGEYVMTFWHH